MQTIVYGIIVLNENLEKSREFIQNLGLDNSFPAMEPQMFSLGSSKRYDDPIISFASTYKYAEDHWIDFIIKFEYILRNIEFSDARIHLEPTISSSYNFFWFSQNYYNGKLPFVEFENPELLIETPDWYFGLGYRNNHVDSSFKLEDLNVFEFENFQYPIRFSAKQKRQFRGLLLLIDRELIGAKQYPYKNGNSDISVKVLDSIFSILKLLSFRRVIGYGFDPALDRRGANIRSLKKFYLILNEKIPHDLDKVLL